MEFETDYKNLHFHIVLEAASATDPLLILGDKFQRLPNQTMIELKKGSLIAFNLVITSSKKEDQRIHYWSNILLPNTTDQDELIHELGYYLNDEEILDEIVKNWELAGDEKGPAWKQALK